MTIFGILGLSTAGLFITFLCSEGRRIDELAFDEIKEGMTFAEVCQTLRAPPGDYGPESHGGGRTGLTMIPIPPAKWESWIDGHTGIYIMFDENGRVSHREFQSNRLVSEESWTDRFRRALARVIRVRK
jgi:hypothetical protein